MIRADIETSRLRTKGNAIKNVKNTGLMNE